MSYAAIDALTSPTLKHLREHWWNDEFTEFITETLRPRPGNRILDVGSGTGVAEVTIGRQHISQIQLFGVDLKIGEVVAASRETASHNQRAHFAGGDACHLPFGDGAFDSTFCVAVLQHIADVDAAVAEIARVTQAPGRIVIVEPDNAARYFYSSSPAGRVAFDLAAKFFAMAAAREPSDLAIGPRIPALLAAHHVEPISVRLFPVSYSRLGAPAADLWTARRAAVERQMDGAADPVRRLGAEYLAALASYERDARQAQGIFVEIQHTTLFATVGQKSA